MLHNPPTTRLLLLDRPRVVGAPPGLADWPLGDVDEVHNGAVSAGNEQEGAKNEQEAVEVKAHAALGRAHVRKAPVVVDPAQVVRNETYAVLVSLMPFSIPLKGAGGRRGGVGRGMDMSEWLEEDGWGGLV